MSENCSSFTLTGRNVTGPPTSGSRVSRRRADNTGPAPMIQIADVYEPNRAIRYVDHGIHGYGPETPERAPGGCTRRRRLGPLIQRLIRRPSDSIELSSAAWPSRACARGRKSVIVAATVARDPMWTVTDVSMAVAHITRSSMLDFEHIAGPFPPCVRC
jgi:hypothetical protein